MIPSTIERLTTRLRATIDKSFDTKTKVHHIEVTDPEGLADEELLVWVIVIDGTSLGFCATVADDDTVTRRPGFADRVNKYTIHTAHTGKILDEVFDAHNQDIAAAQLSVAM
jgi:hypothetical protein